MKKAICILLVFLYTVSVSGMVVQQRFCGSQLMESGLSGTLDDCCLMEEMKSCKTDCCLEKAEVVKVETTHEKSEPLKEIHFFCPVTIIKFSDHHFKTGIFESGSPGFTVTPQKIPLRILHSVFRL